MIQNIRDVKHVLVCKQVFLTRISKLMTWKAEKEKLEGPICTYYADLNIQHIIDAKTVQQI